MSERSVEGRFQDKNLEMISGMKNRHEESRLMTTHSNTEQVRVSYEEEVHVMCHMRRRCM